VVQRRPWAKFQCDLGVISLAAMPLALFLRKIKLGGGALASH